MRRIEDKTRQMWFHWSAKTGQSGFQIREKHLRSGRNCRYGVVMTPISQRIAKYFRWLHRSKTMGFCECFCVWRIWDESPTKRILHVLFYWQQYAENESLAINFLWCAASRNLLNWKFSHSLENAGRYKKLFKYGVCSIIVCEFGQTGFLFSRILMFWR